MVSTLVVKQSSTSLDPSSGNPTSTPSLRPIQFVCIAKTRSGQVPEELLAGYSGYLQVDGYDGYNAVCINLAIIRIGCLAHARRKFDEAIKAQGKAVKSKTGTAHQALAFIAKLYRIEREIKDLSAEERHQRRHRLGLVHNGFLPRDHIWVIHSLSH